MRVQPRRAAGVRMGVLTFGEFEVDLELFQLRQRGDPVDISAKGFDLLLYLIRNRERVVSKEELLSEVWHAQVLSSSAIPTAVLGLRKVLGDDPESPRFIANTPGRGYRFIGEVREPALSPPEFASPAHAIGLTIERSGFVGRVRELAAVAAAFDRCICGVPQTVLLTGEAGIGKTRTAEEFAAQARERGTTVLVGRCHEGEGAPAFWPWVQIVRGLVEHVGRKPMERDIRRLAPVLAQIIPELGERFPGLGAPTPLDAESARFRLFDCVTRLLQKVGSERPLLILLDDLHRADPASLHFLAFVARELRDAQVLLLVTYRDVDAQRDPPRLTAITELARQESSRTIQLHGLSAVEVEEFIASSTLAASNDALAQALFEQSGGNPFFLTQLVHLLEADGSSERVERSVDSGRLLPGGVREAIAKQLEGLPEPTRRVLSIAAAIGREFPAAAIADVMRVPMREVLALIEPAINARLVVAGSPRIGHLRFAHVLLRDVVYEQLDALERLDLHGSIGSALERLYADDLAPYAAELAYHFAAVAHENGAAPAILYAVQAGEWASARLAYEDAARHYRSAIGILEGSGPGNLAQRCELLLALGEAEMNAGERDRARKTFYEAAAHAKRAGHPGLLSRAALRLAPGFFTIEIGVFDSILVNLLGDALVAVGPGDSPLRAQLLARLAMAHGWTGAEERRAQLTVDAVAVAERVGDPLSLAYALSANHGLLWGPERVLERVAVIDRMGMLAAESRDTELILMHLLFRVTSGLELGKIDQVDRDMTTYITIAESRNQPQSLWYAHSFRAAKALIQGRFAEAAGHSERMLSVGGKINDVNCLNSFGIHAAIQLWENDRTAEVIPFADQFVQKYPLIPAWQFSRAFMYFEAGLVRPAKLLFDTLAQDDFAKIPRNEQWSIASVLAADLCYRLEDREMSEVLYAQLAAAKSLYCVIGFGVANLGSIAMRLAMLASVIGKWDVADEHFEQAIRMEESIGSLPWLAHALYWYAKSTNSRGKRSDHNRAIALCDRGSEVAGLAQMPNVSRKLRELRHSLA